MKSDVNRRMHEIVEATTTAEDEAKLLEFLEDFERYRIQKDQLRTFRLALESLMESEPSEEEVHRLMAENRDYLGGPRWRMDEDAVEGVLSKFPLTPDRVPDFTSVALPLKVTQYPSHLRFIELKKPNARLFVQHGRMSRDLNDAWIESVESLRLVGLSYRDIVRRAINAISEAKAASFDSLYKVVSKKVKENGRYFSIIQPHCSAEIFIGRRTDLNSEELLRLQELAASTNGTIRILTYDSLVEMLKNAESDGHLYARWR